jgi:hypothetical protein
MHRVVVPCSLATQFQTRFLIVLPTVHFQVAEGEPGICPDGAKLAPVSWLYLIVLRLFAFRLRKESLGSIQVALTFHQYPGHT